MKEKPISFKNNQLTLSLLSVCSTLKFERLRNF